jgi:hypothetical protein
MASKEEEQKLIDNYQVKLKEELLQIFSPRRWSNIKHMARMLGVKRDSVEDAKIKRGRSIESGVMVCSRCGETKSLDHFYHPTRDTICKECIKGRAMSPEVKKRNKERSIHRDAFSYAYNHVVNKTKKRKPVDPNLKREDVLKIAEKQNYRCALTGALLNRDRLLGAWDINNPSLDRIDNTKGYQLDNVRWVSVWANMARHNWSDEEFYRLCRETTEFYDNDLHHNA